MEAEIAEIEAQIGVKVSREQAIRKEIADSKRATEEEIRRID